MVIQTEIKPMPNNIYPPRRSSEAKSGGRLRIRTFVFQENIGTYRQLRASKTPIS